MKFASTLTVDTTQNTAAPNNTKPNGTFTTGNNGETVALVAHYWTHMIFIQDIKPLMLDEVEDTLNARNPHEASETTGNDGETVSLVAHY
jgi:hypothetical protein